MSTSTRRSVLAWSSVAAWAASLAAAVAAIQTEHILWRTILLITLAAAMVTALAWLILTNLPPIAAVYAVARKAPCDCLPPRLPVVDDRPIGGKVIPMPYLAALDHVDN